MVIGTRERFAGFKNGFKKDRRGIFSAKNNKYMIFFMQICTLIRNNAWVACPGNEQNQ